MVFAQQCKEGQSICKLLDVCAGFQADVQALAWIPLRSFTMAGIWQPY